MKPIILKNYKVLYELGFDVKILEGKSVVDGLLILRQFEQVLRDKYLFKDDVELKFHLLRTDFKVSRGVMF